MRVFAFAMMLGIPVVAGCATPPASREAAPPEAGSAPAIPPAGEPIVESEPEPKEPAKTSAPTKAERLTAALEPSKSTFAHYESLEFEVTFANLSDEGMTLFDHEFHPYWEYTFVGVGDDNRGKEWRPRCGLAFDRIGRIFDLEAGAESVFTIRMTAFEFPDLPLPPGEYEMSVAIKLEECPDGFWKPKFPSWSGTLTPQPVRVTVVATDGSEWTVDFQIHGTVVVRGEVWREHWVEFRCDASGDYETSWVFHNHLAKREPRKRTRKGRMDRCALGLVWWHIERARLDRIEVDEFPLADHMRDASVYEGVLTLRQAAATSRVAFRRDLDAAERLGRDQRDLMSRCAELVAGLRDIAVTRATETHDENANR